MKSCAIPPASWPIASIFCAWRSCSSRLRRSVWSRPNAIQPSCSPSGETIARVRHAMVRSSPLRVRTTLSNASGMAAAPVTRLARARIDPLAA